VKGGQFEAGFGEELLVEEEFEAEDPMATDCEMEGLLVMTNWPRI
jgi:hypothetical protein